jgi:transcriptional regulator with XRE-family HTH domain
LPSRRFDGGVSRDQQELNNMKGIGLRLRQERTRLKLSQSALGAVGGVETNAQGNYESGARYPKADYLLRVAGAGVDLDFVLTGNRHRTVESIGDRPLPEDNEDLLPPLTQVNHQLHRNLFGLMDASLQLTRLVDVRANDPQFTEANAQLDNIRVEAQSLAQATMRLIFETSKLV